MIKLLAKIFIKNSDFSDNKVREKYGVLTGAVGIFLNLLISIGKIVMGIITGAISFVADGLNNVTDAGSSVISIIGFKLSGKPIDNKHPFGRGRMEYISGLIVALIIVVVGVELVISSVERIITPDTINKSVLSMVILGISILVKAYMFAYNYIYGKKINSQSMRATALDSICDAASTSTVLIGAIIHYYTDVVLDSYIGILVAVMIMFTGGKSIKEVVSLLIGSKPDPEFVKKISEKVLAYPIVLGIHDLVVHDYGVGRSMITLHAEVSADSNIMEAHDWIDNIEQDLQETFKCNAVIHYDPVYTNDPILNQAKETLHKIVNDMNPHFSVHDIRMNQGPTHTNLIFDLVLPANQQTHAESISNSITQKVKECLGESYNCVIKVDVAYA